MAALTPVFLFFLFLSANSDESSKLDSSCFSAIPISNSVAALYVFGDSTVDAGNNNYIDNAARANFLPYGIDFNNTPTGRFTNGKTIADFIAILYNLSLPPPYLSLMEAQRKTTMGGINYASAGCGISPNTKPNEVKYFQLFLLLVNPLNLIRGVHHGFPFDNLNR
ncbi:GDSL esterase/lipase At2g03980-like [Camellia sinensis]|uniref:GDSL esterase/lipase At2g03980-like n=1 Tax=Camellia sinensis TaxID=4442 RepID=UPI0010356D3C|nr:GDSL esterase/lipase At2g03980-like [Camellia sinensis]